MRVSKCKGTRDLSPADMAKFRRLEAVFRGHCLKWGYEEVRTPTLEYLHLFTATGTLTPSMLGRVYSFLDWDGWSGERVVLRPDVTIPIARLYIDGMSDRELARLFYLANTFIFEETGKKNRERWQCGAELIGAGSATADVELIALATEALRGLGIKKVDLKLSHAGLIKALLKSFGLSVEEQARIFDLILDGDEAALARLKPPEPELAGVLPDLLKPREKAADYLKEVRAKFNRHLADLGPSLDKVIDITELLESQGYKYILDITSGTGFEYYTGVIFQFFAGGDKIGGGGRYDDLVSLLGGGDIPASGFALYIDRLMGRVVEASAGPEPKRVLVRALPGVVKAAFAIASRLRQAGYVAEIDLGKPASGEGGWTLTVGDKAPRFMLTGPVGQRKFEADTADEVIALLGKEG